MNDEFFKLFVGLGSGELIPYASWYIDKKIQSMPLVHLRTDLNRLGIVKQNNGMEPEDHAASICEVMTIISDGQNGCSFDDQADFFRHHLGPWMVNFFHDLGNAKSADFYRKVGDFGSQFMKYESQYLDYPYSGNLH
jgi:TorA maturation chaperone TorD